MSVGVKAPQISPYIIHAFAREVSNIFIKNGNIVIQTILLYIYNVSIYFSLSQWLKYSEKEFCELCNYRYTFIPSKYFYLCFIITTILYVTCNHLLLPSIFT